MAQGFVYLSAIFRRVKIAAVRRIVVRRTSSACNTMAVPSVAVYVNPSVYVLAVKAAHPQLNNTGSAFHGVIPERAVHVTRTGPVVVAIYALHLAPIIVPCALRFAILTAQANVETRRASNTHQT